MQKYGTLVKRPNHKCIMPANNLTFIFRKSESNVEDETEEEYDEDKTDDESKSAEAPASEKKDIMQTLSPAPQARKKTSVADVAQALLAEVRKSSVAAARPIVLPAADTKRPPGEEVTSMPETEAAKSEATGTAVADEMTAPPISDAIRTPGVEVTKQLSMLNVTENSTIASTNTHVAEIVASPAIEITKPSEVIRCPVAEASKPSVAEVSKTFTTEATRSSEPTRSAHASGASRTSKDKVSSLVAMFTTNQPAKTEVNRPTRVVGPLAAGETKTKPAAEAKSEGAVAEKIAEVVRNSAKITISAVDSGNSTRERERQ